MPIQSLLIIGGGPGGYAAALEAAQRKIAVTLVDSHEIGGTCLNRGCIPSKFFLSKAKQVADAQHLSASGIELHLEKVRMGTLVNQKNDILTTLRQRMEQACKAGSIKRVTGKAHFLSPKEIEVVSASGGTQKLTADAILLATGSSPVLPKVFPKHPAIFSSTSILDMEHLPAHLGVVGGGYIGCELACAFHGLGSKVTLIEKEPRLLPTQAEFEAAGTILQRSFEKRGMTVWTKTTVDAVTPVDDHHLKIKCSNGETIEANALLLALGRAPALLDLNIDGAGLALENGRPKINASMQTNISHIYAIGDLVSPLPLAHVAAREAHIAVAHMTGEKAAMDYPSIPRCVYTWPEAAAVGLTEAEALKAGFSPRMDRYHYAANSKALIEGETEGLWMIVTDSKTRKILGGQIVGTHATELIHLLSLSIKAGLTVDQIADTVFAHPSLSESFGEAMQRNLAASAKKVSS